MSNQYDTPSLVGQQFGRLAVLSYAYSRNRQRYWKCLCECGNFLEVDTNHLRSGHTKSCGCRKGKNPRIHAGFVGQRFGRLQVIEKSDIRNRRQFWKCLCDCGNFAEIHTAVLRNGATKSCGCLVGVYHGKSQTPEYKIWKGIHKRCLNRNTRQFKDYGGRGISVSPRWDSFENFYEDMGLRPSDKHSIERVNNNGNYEKSNCVWATMTQQARNTRRNRLITFNGETLCLSEWAARMGLKPSTLYGRLKKWPLEKALTSPLGKSHWHKVPQQLNLF